MEGSTLSKKKSKTIGRRQKDEVLARGECCYCGARENLSVDHAQPVSKGGTRWMGNLRCCCWRCNIVKGDMTEAEYLAWLDLGIEPDTARLGDLRSREEKFMKNQKATRSYAGTQAFLAILEKLG